MKVARGFRSLAVDVGASAVSIGNFDGVHLGHRAVINSAVKDADRQRATAVVCTFDPHTRAIVGSGEPPELLQTLDQRLAAIGALGADLVVVIPFNVDVARVLPEEFVTDFLVERLRARAVHVSDSFRFGRGGSGNVELLERLGAELGFEVRRVAPVYADGGPVSSTRIRELVREGGVEEAGRLLGRPFALVGRVVRGAGRGQRIGVPTANLAVENRCLPGAGVYVSEARIGGARHPAVSNVGHRPTFGGDPGVTVEAHLLDYENELYGQPLELGLLSRLRDERSFDGPETLVRQIRQDIEEARAWFESSTPS